MKSYHHSTENEHNLGTAPLAEPGRGWLTWQRVAILTAMLSGLVTFFAFGGPDYLSWESLKANRDELRRNAESHPWETLTVFFILYVATAGLSIPVTPVLSLAAGLLFDRWLGTAVVGIAATAGAALGFLSSRYLFRDLIQRRFGSRLEGLQRRVEASGAWYLLSLRLFPFMSYTLINVGMGLTRMRLRTFCLVSFVGMLPTKFLFVHAGTELSQIESPGDVLSLEVLGALALLALVPLAARGCVRLIAARQAGRK